VHLPPLALRLAAAAALAAAVAAPGRALADEPPKEAPGSEGKDPKAAEEVDPEEGTPRSPPPDDRVGHILLYPRFGYVGPAGRLDAAPETNVRGGTSTADVAGPGMGFGGTLGVGIGRQASIEVTGQYTLFGSPGACPVGVACKGHSADFGLGLAYHLAQGVAIDPWGSFGVGLRLGSFTVPKPPTGGGIGTGPLSERDYRGVDIARIAFGADFYPVPAFGFGPYVEIDVGTPFSRPDPTLSTAAYAFFHVGFRLAFDPIRTAPPRPRAAAQHGSGGI
jgi:hypothetical protein